MKIWRYAGMKFHFLVALASFLLMAIALPVGSRAEGDAPAAPKIQALSTTDWAGRLKPFDPNARPQVGLNDDLAIELDQIGSLDAAKYALFLNGIEIPGLDAQREGDALIFRLHRNGDNARAWSALLSSPSWTRQVSVALGEKKTSPAVTQPTIRGGHDEEPKFDLVLLSPLWMGLASVPVVAMLVLVWGSAKKTGILKDSLVPQMDPTQQTYSLGRWQMAFWFTLVFISFIFLFILLWDVNTVTSQALMLMGISGATALFAVTVDQSKDFKGRSSERAAEGHWVRLLS